MIRPAAAAGSGVGPCCWLLLLLLATADGARSLQQAANPGLICNGQLQKLTIPQAPYPQSPPWDTPYTNPEGLYCSRPQAGAPGFGSRCGSQPSVQCLPFSGDIGIGPTNQAPQLAPDNLAIPPDNPLLFTLDAGSQKRFLFLNWTVFDVGTGGAKLVANYADGGTAEVVTHSPFRNGPQPDGSGTASCGPCSDCNIGLGIKAMSVRSLRNSGFVSFALSQLYTNTQCGATCFDLDASYWVGMEYSCVEPTCANTDVTSGSSPQPFDCAPFSAVLNPAAADSNVLTVQSCCLPKTCNSPDPVAKPGVPFPCSEFNIAPVPPANTGTNCTNKSPMPSPILGVSLGACCECVTYSASTNVDLRVTKEVTALKKKKTTKKKKKTTTISAQSAISGDDDDKATEATEVVAAAAATKAFGSTASQSVGAAFTFRLTVTNEALYSAEDVELVDTMPAGLTIQSVSESPFARACTFAGDTLRCSWARFDIQSPKAVTVTAVGTSAGTWQNCAQVSTSSTDVNPSNDQDCATAVITGACCTTSVGGSAVCQDTLSADCRRISSPTMQQVFNPDISCADSQCAIKNGACCLKSSTSGTDVCIDSLAQESCLQNAGIFFQGGRCSTGLCGGTSADLVLTMKGPTTPQALGATFPFDINVRLNAPSNTPQTVSLVSMTNSVPPGLEIVSVAEVPNKGGIINISPDKTRVTVTWPTMSVPNDVNRNVVVTVKSTKSGTFTSPSRVTTTSTETNLNNNADSATVVIKDPGNTADLSLLLAGPTQPATPGTIVPVTALVKLTSPTSPVTVKDVQVVQDMPPGLTIVSVTENPPSRPPAQIEFSPSSLTAYWPSMSLPSDSTRTLTVNVRANTEGSYTTNARVITSSPETNTANNADSATVVVQGKEPVCAPEWRPCDPNNPDACCDGLSCEFTWAGCKVGSYVCKSRGGMCVGEGSPCGGSSGLTCCKGMMCQWDYYQNQGTCRSSSGCIPPGGGCSNDYSVCRGCLCMGGKSKYVTYNMCNKKCSSYNCYYQRQINCQCFYASAASL